MIQYVEGDLLASDCTVILHQANCFSAMGAGIAYQIALKYPEAARADAPSDVPPADRLGDYTDAYVGDVHIVNLYGQYHPGPHTDYKALFNAMYLAFGTTHPLDKIGLPYKIGCGIGGGDWRVVYKIISLVSLIWVRDVYIYYLPKDTPWHK